MQPHDHDEDGIELTLQAKTAMSNGQICTTNKPLAFQPNPVTR